MKTKRRKWNNWNHVIFFPFLPSFPCVCFCHYRNQLPLYCCMYRSMRNVVIVVQRVILKQLILYNVFNTVHRLHRPSLLQIISNAWDVRHVHLCFQYQTHLIALIKLFLCHILSSVFLCFVANDTTYADDFDDEKQSSRSSHSTSSSRSGGRRDSSQSGRSYTDDGG